MLRELNSLAADADQRLRQAAISGLTNQVRKYLQKTGVLDWFQTKFEADAAALLAGEPIDVGVRLDAAALSEPLVAQYTTAPLTAASERLNAGMPLLQVYVAAWLLSFV